MWCLAKSPSSWLMRKISSLQRLPVSRYYLWINIRLTSKKAASLSNNTAVSASNFAKHTALILSKLSLLWRRGGACVFKWSWELSRRWHSYWQGHPSRTGQRWWPRQKGTPWSSRLGGWSWGQPHIGEKKMRSGNVIDASDGFSK